MFYLSYLCQSILSKPHEKKTIKCLQKLRWWKTAFAMLYWLTLLTVLHRLTLLADVPVAAVFLKFSLVFLLMLFTEISQPYINVLRKNGSSHRNRNSKYQGHLFLVWSCAKCSTGICSLSALSIISSQSYTWRKLTANNHFIFMSFIGSTISSCVCVWGGVP